MENNLSFFQGFSTSFIDHFKYNSLSGPNGTELASFYGAFIDYKNLKCDVAEEYCSHENREAFLSYILPLLKENKLKVCIDEIKYIPATDEEKKIHGDSLAPNYATAKVIKSFKNLPAEDSIELIRKYWYSCPQEYLRNFEQFGVLFALPDSDIWKE